MNRLRVIEDPLGEDAKERPDRPAIDELWEAARRLPIPDYDGEILRRFLRRRAR